MYICVMSVSILRTYIFSILNILYNIICMYVFNKVVAKATHKECMIEEGVSQNQSMIAKAKACVFAPGGGGYESNMCMTLWPNRRM